MAEENDVIISEIKNFLKQEKNKKKFITPYHKEELKSEDNKDINFEYQIYNECSLQHELGWYLRKNLGKGYKVFFEKNTKTFLENPVVKKDEEDEQKKYEVDLIIIKKEQGEITEKYAIELKFPINGQYPEQMEKFIDDMNFMKQVYDAWKKENDVKSFKFNTYCLTLVNDNCFYMKTGKEKDNKNYKYYEYYSYFREGLKNIKIELDTKYKIENTIQWNPLKELKELKTLKNHEQRAIKCYLVNIEELKFVKFKE